MASARDYAFVVFRSNWENPQISHAAVDDGGTRSVMEAIRWGGGWCYGLLLKKGAGRLLNCLIAHQLLETRTDPHKHLVSVLIAPIMCGTLCGSQG